MVAWARHWISEFAAGRRPLAVGRLVITGCRNGTGAPLVDEAWSTGRDSETGRVLWKARGYAVSLTRARNEHGERLRGPAMFVGWKRADSVASQPTAASNGLH